MTNASRQHGTIVRHGENAFALHRLQIWHPKPQNSDLLSESIVFKNRGAPRNRQKHRFRFRCLRILGLDQKWLFLRICVAGIAITVYSEAFLRRLAIEFGSKLLQKCANRVRMSNICKINIICTDSTNSIDYLRFCTASLVLRQSICDLK